MINLVLQTGIQTLRTLFPFSASSIESMPKKSSCLNCPNQNPEQAVRVSTHGAILQFAAVGFWGDTVGHDIFTWDNLITWVVCSFFIYTSLNFRLYMIFHHPGRKLRRKVANRHSGKACNGALCAKQAL
jgi:hypothetical protein